MRPIGPVLVGGPEAGRVRGERLVGDHEPAVPVDAELELGVGQDDPALECALRGEAVQLEGESLGWDKTYPGPELPADVVDGTRARYVDAFERLTGIEFARYLADPEVVLA